MKPFLCNMFHNWAYGKDKYKIGEPKPNAAKHINEIGVFTRVCKRCGKKQCSVYPENSMLFKGFQDTNLNDGDTIFIKNI